MTEPAPLTPPGCDLRPFRDMPIDIGRFRQSDLVTEEDPEAVLAAILLWGAAWHEVPAASVPNNDRWLAKAAGYGRAVDSWLRVKQGALRGFVLCSDGRLYNRTLAEKAVKAWDGRLKHDWRKAGERHRKAQRDLDPAERTPFPDFEDWVSGGPDAASFGIDDLFRRNDPENPPEKSLKGMEGNGREWSPIDGDAGASAPPPPASKRTKGVKRECPVDFTPSPGSGSKTAERMAGWTPDHLADQVERFIAHHRAKGNKFSDWNAAWTTWVLNSFDRNGGRNGGGYRNGAGSRPNGDGFTRAIDERLGNGGPDDHG